MLHVSINNTGDLLTWFDMVFVILIRSRYIFVRFCLKLWGLCLYCIPNPFRHTTRHYASVICGKVTQRQGSMSLFSAKSERLFKLTSIKASAIDH